MDHKEIGRDDVVWIHLAQVMVEWRALVDTAMNLLVP